jgi:hypothetical protein
MDEKKYFCQLCNFKSNYNSEIEIHLNSEKHKRGGKKKEYNCDVCSYKTIVSLWNLKMHKASKHYTKEEREQSKYYCKTCDSIFFSPLYYNNHLKSIMHQTKTNKLVTSDNSPMLSLLDKKLFLMKEEIKRELYNELLDKLKEYH